MFAKVPILGFPIHRGLIPTCYNFPQNIVFLSRKIDFELANSVDPDEVLHYAACHLGLQCLPKYPFWGFGIIF